MTELLREAMAVLDVADADARAARLFVVAARLQATGDAVATAEARALLARAADDGSAFAAFDLAMLLLAGHGGPVDTDGGLAWLARAAASVPAAAAVLGGLLLLDGARASEGIAQLRRAAGAGEPTAFWLLGAAALRGIGGPVDARQARVYFVAAAEAGVAEAQLELATLYATGVGGARDEVAAARWEEAAAEGGNAVACLRVGDRAAARPGGVTRAIPWYERGAEAGSAEAAARLAKLYLTGAAVPYDAALAERWMARAKALGWSWEAQ